MTKQFIITPNDGHEPPSETPMSIAFRGLLTSLRDFIAAERDLEDIAYSQDPAYADWAHESEMAFEGLVASTIAIHRLPIECREDRPLHRMALLVDAMLGHEEPGGARALHLQMHLAFFTSFQVGGLALPLCIAIPCSFKRGIL
jgi:hypothetical protein